MGVAGLLVGLIGAFIPPVIGRDPLSVMGVSYDQIHEFLHATDNDNIPLGLQSFVLIGVILFALKLLTTSLSIGSGASGGIFAPGLYLGAALGAATGSLFHYLLPLQTPIGTFALIGMGALFGGVARAPFTMIVMTAELTGDYKVFLPVILAVSISYWINEWLNRYSIYTQKLANRGLIIRRERIDELLERINVVDVMTKDIITLRKDTTINEAAEIALVYKFNSYPIVDEDNTLLGIITLEDIRKAQVNDKGNELAINHAFCKGNIYCLPFDTMREAMDKMYSNRTGRIAVVNNPKEKKLVGLITRSDIMNIVESQNIRILNKRELVEPHTKNEMFVSKNKLVNYRYLRDKIKRVHVVLSSPETSSTRSMPAKTLTKFKSKYKKPFSVKIVLERVLTWLKSIPTKIRKGKKKNKSNEEQYII